MIIYNKKKQKSTSIFLSRYEQHLAHSATPRQQDKATQTGALKTPKTTRATQTQSPKPVVTLPLPTVITPTSCQRTLGHSID